MTKQSQPTPSEPLSENDVAMLQALAFLVGDPMAKARLGELASLIEQQASALKAAVLEMQSAVRLLDDVLEMPVGIPVGEKLAVRVSAIQRGLRTAIREAKE
jgi:GAF domain-containing protein